MEVILLVEGSSVEEENLQVVAYSSVVVGYLEVVHPLEEVACSSVVEDYSVEACSWEAEVNSAVE